MNPCCQQLVDKGECAMIDIVALDGIEKLAVTCLYYAQLKSDDVRYANKKCVDMLTLVMVMRNSYRDSAQIQNLTRCPLRQWMVYLSKLRIWL